MESKDCQLCIEENREPFCGRNSVKVLTNVVMFYIIKAVRPYRAGIFVFCESFLRAAESVSRKIFSFRGKNHVLVLYEQVPKLKGGLTGDGMERAAVSEI